MWKESVNKWDRKNSQKTNLESQFNSPPAKEIEVCRARGQIYDNIWTLIGSLPYEWWKWCGTLPATTIPPNKMGFSVWKKPTSDVDVTSLLMLIGRIPHRVHSTHWQLQIVELSKASSDWSCQRNPPMRRCEKIKQCQGPIPWVHEKSCLPLCFFRHLS